VKAQIQAFLKHVGLYQRLKSSLIYDLYWAFANRRLLEARANEVKFYEKTLKGFRNGNVIFDVGANQGHKTDIFLRLGAKVVSVDPDKTNQKALSERFLKYRLRPKRVNVEGKAVSDAITVRTMWIEAPGSAKNTLNGKWVDVLRNDDKRFGQRTDFPAQRMVKTTTLEELMTTYGIPFFIKIDVEGHEAHVLRGLNRPVPYLSFEVNLPEFRLEGLECVNTLSQIFIGGKFNYTIDCERGLILDSWMRARDFARVIKRCDAPSIEVFWRTHICVN